MGQTGNQGEKTVRERVEQMQQMTLADFTQELSGNAPVPGGGGTAALCGALAASLSSMVASLTVGKKKYEAVREDMNALIRDAGRLREEFLNLIDEDAEAFKPLAAAYRLPQGTEEEKAARRYVMEQALRHAAESPLRILEKTRETLTLVRTAARKGSVIAVSDAGCSAAILEAAARSAALNVTVNTRLMGDHETARRLEQQAQEVLAECQEESESIYQSVSSFLQQSQ